MVIIQFPGHYKCTAITPFVQSQTEDVKRPQVNHTLYSQRPRQLPASKVMEYRVDSLHINVEHGDCALHLLVSMGLNSRKIVRAVLIDGGKGSKNNMQALHDTLLFASASSRYTDHSIIQLDAIIVTHWDTDHYLGIVQVFKDDYDTCQLTGENFPRIIKKASNGNPTTNFFCPNWNATPILDGSGVQKAHGTAFGTSTDGIYVTLTFNKVAYPIGILCCGNILGAEIFSGQPCKRDGFDGIQY